MQRQMDRRPALVVTPMTRVVSQVAGGATPAAVNPAVERLQAVAQVAAGRLALRDLHQRLRISTVRRSNGSAKISSVTTISTPGAARTIAFVIAHVPSAKRPVTRKCVSCATDSIPPLPSGD